MKNNRFKFIVNALKSSLFVLTLIVGLIVSMLIPLRPTYSENEKRELTKFPALTASSLADGSFFAGIDTWFADTFPFREAMISAYGGIEDLYGLHTTKVHGKVDDGDDIPDTPSKAGASSGASSGTASSGSSSTGSSSAASSQDNEPAEQGLSMGGVLLIKNAAYEYYNFNKSCADRYSAAVTNAANRLNGISNVYDMVVPTSIGITLNEATRKSINSSDQQKAINYIYGSMGDGVKTVNVYDTLMSHRSEYIFFRTDHHWTQLGAYYAYQQFANRAKFMPIEQSRYSTVTYDGFLGSFYAATKKDATLAATPDSITAFKLINNASMNVVGKNGSSFSWPIIGDPTKSAENLKYAATFIGGDNPLSTITNNDLPEGDSCILVKESFGNAFAPLLIPHYKNIYVVDYRYYKGGLIRLAQEKGVKDVIFLNNISATRTSARVTEMENLINR